MLRVWRLAPTYIDRTGYLPEIGIVHQNSRYKDNDGNVHVRRNNVHSWFSNYGYPMIHCSMSRPTTYVMTRSMGRVMRGHHPEPQTAAPTKGIGTR
jgi:hypothetical protein